MIESGDRISVCSEHGPSCQLDYPFRLMGQFDLSRAVLRPQRGARVRMSTLYSGGKSETQYRISDWYYATRAEAAKADHANS